MKSQFTYCYRFIAWLLLLVYLANPLRVFQPFLTYQINYDYISKVLCVNKDKPKMECNGKCHLKKELKKQTENNSENQNTILKLTVSEELANSEITLKENKYFSIEQNLNDYFSYFYSDPSLNNNTPPPKS
jgi:hypothetical protein